MSHSQHINIYIAAVEWSLSPISFELNDELYQFLSKIYGSGTDHDSKTNKHTEQMLNITPDTGLFFSILTQAVRAMSVLEIGTSNGYSTLWITDAIRNNGGKIVPIEVSEKKAAMARDNFERSGL